MKQIKINYECEVLLALLRKESHGRELAKTLGTSLTRIQLLLSRWYKAGVVDFRVEGKNHIYGIKKTLVAKINVFNAENYKLIKLLGKYPFLEPIIQEIHQKCSNGLIVLFGSYAKFSPRQESDIDIYIESTDKKVKEATEQINEKISVKMGKFNKEDLLIQEIIKNHIIIQRGDLFYEKSGFFA